MATPLKPTFDIFIIWSDQEGLPYKQTYFEEMLAIVSRVGLYIYILSV